MLTGSQSGGIVNAYFTNELHKQQLIPYDNALFIGLVYHKCEVSANKKVERVIQKIKEGNEKRMELVIETMEQ